MRLFDRIAQHPAVDKIYDESGEFPAYFVYLKPGWEWSEQKGFGTEDIREAWALVKQAKFVGVKSDT